MTRLEDTGGQCSLKQRAKTVKLVIGLYSANNYYDFGKFLLTLS